MSRCRHILQSLWFDDAGTRRSTGPNCQRSSSGSRDLWTTWVSSILHYIVLSLASQTAATPHCQEMIMKRWGGKILCFERSACWCLAPLILRYKYLHRLDVYLLDLSPVAWRNLWSPSVKFNFFIVMNCPINSQLAQMNLISWFISYGKEVTNS